MAIPNNDKHKEYARYAAYCLTTRVEPRDPAKRDIQREMALEWVRLADAALDPPALS
jgi:hypothetical protein